MIGVLGKTSYALFLVHFSVLMIGNALFERLGPDSAELAWLAVVFARWVEVPLSRLGYRGNIPRAAATQALL